jgi:ankyrin repeat protein
VQNKSRPMARASKQKGLLVELVEAIKKNDPDAARAALERGASANGENGGQPVLALAAQFGYHECAKALLDHGADPEGSPDSPSPLGWASNVGSLSCVRLLVEAGAHVDRRDGHNGATPLYRSVLRGCHEAAEELIKAGADLEARLDGGHGPLGAALGLRDIKMALMLLNAGADASSVDADGWTPAIAAAAAACWDALEMLVDRGADLGVEDAKGWTARDYAQLGRDASRGVHEIDRLMARQERSVLETQAGVGQGVARGPRL